jgi:hypothetical protein
MMGFGISLGDERKNARHLRNFGVLVIHGLEALLPA